MARKARKVRVKKTKTEGSVIDPARYDVTRVRDAKTGRVRHSRGNGDAIAKAMLVATANGIAITKIAKDNGLGDRMKGRDGLNAGLQRMTLGVMLRKLVKDGTAVKIGDITVKTLGQKVAMPKVEAKAAA